MNAPATFPAVRKWNWASSVRKCDDCEGYGYHADPRHPHANDPSRYDKPCETCEATGLHTCEVCGFDEIIPGVDCLACDMVAEIPARLLTDNVADKLAAAVRVAIGMARAA